MILGKSPLVAGFWSALSTAGVTVCSFISASRSTGTANRLIVIVPIVSAASLALLALLMPMAGLSQQGSAKWLMLPLLGVGVGVGLCWPNILTRVDRKSTRLNSSH